MNAYQSATASNDVLGARNALLQLVQAKDDVPDYWVQLGRLDASMGRFNDAYYAFSRAYELDRSNVDVLRAVTQLALHAGDLAGARTHARELEVLAPGDPWPKITKGWAEISELRYGEALATADGILANSPYDAVATVLKARALVGLNRNDDARALLIKEVQAQPSDIGSLEFLERMYAHDSDWPNLLKVSQRLTQLVPGDNSFALKAIEAGLRSKDITAANAMSHRLLTPKASPDVVSSVLSLWEDYWPSPERLDEARSLASQATSLPSRVVYASFLSRFGSPADAAQLTVPAATLPVDAKNAEANAVFADALSRLGKVGPAKSRLDAVLAFDPGNATALRSRAELELRTDQQKAAVTDAEKLTTVLPTSSSDRLLLAKAYAAGGNTPWMERTLWSAFKDIPADEKLFAALEASKKGNPDATRQLQEEFDHQRDAKLARGLM